MTAVIGIDPGLDGALAWLSGDILETFDVPTLEMSRNSKAKREVDHYALARILDELTGRTLTAPHVIIEQVGSMPGQGVSSVFSFGKTYGTLIGVCAGNYLPITFVAPQTWKKALHVPAAKDGARAVASATFPRHGDQWPLKKHDGRAEAALIASYGRQRFVDEARAA